MIIQKHIEISYLNIIQGILRFFIPWKRSHNILYDKISSSINKDVIVCYSVRTAFDAYLQLKKFPDGSEILISQITIPDMVHICNKHQLKVVPVEIDMETLRVKIDSLKKSINPRTCAIVLTHLFGTYTITDEIIKIAKNNKLIIIEDSAQYFTGSDYLGHMDADISMFSFGPIKTMTSLGGALCTVKKINEKKEMKRIIHSYYCENDLTYLKKIMKYALYKFISLPSAYCLIISILTFLNLDYEAVVNSRIKLNTVPALF